MAHIVNAIGLLEGSLYITLKNNSILARWAAVAIILTFCGGLLTVITKSDWWSFVMTFGFIVSLWLYGLLYVSADRIVRDNNKTDE